MFDTPYPNLTGPGGPGGPGAVQAAPRDMTNVQPTPVRPPLPQDQPDGPPSLYEQLQMIFNEVRGLAHQKTPRGKRAVSPQELDDYVKMRSYEVFQGAHNYRTVGHLARMIQNLDTRGLRPVSQDDLSPVEKGAFARTALAGKGLSFGVSPYLSGLQNIDRVTNLSDIAQQYREGRDEANNYFKIAQGSVNKEGWRRAFNPQMWGTIGATVAMGPHGPAGMIRSAGTGALVSGLGTLGELPDLSPQTLKENALPIATNTAMGALLGATPALTSRLLAARYAPGALQALKTFEETGGEPALERAIRRYGNPRPMLSELRETSLGRMGRSIGFKSPEAATEALDRTRQQIGEVVAAKQAFNDRYAILQSELDNPRAREILKDHRVQEIGRELILDGVIDPNQPLTARGLEDLRQAIGEEANIFKKAGKGRVAKMLFGYEDELKGIIDNSHPDMPQVRAEYAPLSARHRELARLEQRLERSLNNVRGQQGVAPVETKTTSHGMIREEMGREPWQLSARAARQNAGLLYTPGTAAEHAARIGSGMPWYTRLGNMLTPGAAAIPYTNPFFQQEPQQ